MTIDEKLDLIIQKLETLFARPTDGDTETILTTPGVGNLLPVRIKKAGGDTDQQFGFGEDGPHQSVDAEVQRGSITVSADGTHYETRNKRIAKLYAKGE